MAENLNNYLNLTVLSGILKDPLIAAFAAYRNAKSPTPALKAAFFHELFERGAESNFAAYVADAVMADDNAFSRGCAAGYDLSDYLKNAYIADLLEIGRALDFESEEFAVGKPPVLIKSWDDKAANLLYGYYQSSGYGVFIANTEFRYEKERGLVPVPRPRYASPAALKGYEKERAEIYDDLENFVKGLPCAGLFLCGESGTGKSTLLRATASAFFSQKLRIVDLAREDVRELPSLVSYLSALPLRFLVFLRNIGGDTHIPDISAENVLIAATGKTPVEGFGMRIGFGSGGEEAYLAIVRELAKEYKVKVSEEELSSYAAAWMERHGCTPRSARLLAGYLLACQKKGKEIKT